MNEVLTLKEVAEFLRTDIRTTTKLLESGELTGFRVNEEWRVLAPALIKFLGDQTEQEQQKIILRELSDPKSWARNLRKDPQFESEIRTTDFLEGTMGAFLKRGLTELEARGRAGNIVYISPSTED
jgi:hypothetical protein